jgi:hypothetical protein
MQYSVKERIAYYTAIANYLRAQSKRINQRLLTLHAELEREKAAVPRERSASDEALDAEILEKNNYYRE